MRRCFLFLILILPLRLWADTVTEDFTSRANFESGTAVWNQALGKIHPSLKVTDYKVGWTPIYFDVGDGSDGVFDVSTYANFSVNGDLSGNIIRLDLSRFPILKVTSFHLAPGWFLEPVGDAPLQIYSLNNVTIEGEIWCHGHNGNPASGATPGTGGTGRCGGKAGGNGGAVAQSGFQGTDADATVTGGAGGDYDAGTPARSVGGGGGGTWNTTTPAGSDPHLSNGGTGGTAGNSNNDPDFAINATGSGAGGGGGSGNNAEAGGGGGAGGGTVIIHAVGAVQIGTSANPTGFIYAYGGDGGNANVGGVGGAGGGGSVKIFTGSSIEFWNTSSNPSASEARGGNAGSNSVAPLNGATGGTGRSWVVTPVGGYNTNGASGGYNPPEEITLNTGTMQTQYETNSPVQEVISKSIDLQNTLATVDSLTLTPTSGDFQYFIKGSNDDFATDDTGWTTDLTLVTHKRFVKFKVVINTSTPASPTMLDQLQISYTPGTQKDFDFKTSGCGMISPPSPPSGPQQFLVLLLLFLPAVFAATHYRRRISSSDH